MYSLIQPPRNPRLIGLYGTKPIPSSRQVQHAVRLHVAVHQVVFALNGCQRAYGMGPADGVGADLAHAPVLHLALFHQVGNGLRHLLGRYVRVGAVLVEHRQRVEPQAAGESSQYLRIVAGRLS